MKPSLLSLPGALGLLVVATLASGAHGGGCFDDRPPPAGCPEVMCDLACETGHEVDANGCDLCECNDPPAPVSCQTEADCPTGKVCDLENFCDAPVGCEPGDVCLAVCAGRCVEPAPVPTSCFAHDDCAADEKCDLENFCDAPPGCSAGQVCPDVCAGRCVTGERVTVCWSDDECGAGRRCDLVNFCEHPPGCGDDDACPPVCYGRCVVDEGPKPCDGAWLDRNGVCRTPADGVYPPECCAGQACHDGSEAVCDMVPPDCGPGRIAAVRDGCYACVNPDTCLPGCGDGSALACRRMEPVCDPGFEPAIVNGCYECRFSETCTPACTIDRDCDLGRCVEKSWDPCPPTAPDEPRCMAPTRLYNVCEPAACTAAMCSLVCEHGFATDPATGCETCACREPPDCTCTREYAPVCGADGVTYGNRCLAACAETTVVAAGECGAECDVACVRYDPVCGTDGVTYGCGEVEARCQGVEVAYAGECRNDCDIACFRYDPVCGTDGVTYACGEVEARCRGVEVAYPGECRAPTPGCDRDVDCAWGEECFRPAGPTVGPVDRGQCRPVGWCETAHDCDGLVSCVGSWSCSATNHCEYTCER